MGIWRLAYVEKAALARYIRPVWLRVCIFNEVRMRSSKLLRDSYLSPRGFLISGISLLDYPL